METNMGSYFQRSRMSNEAQNNVNSTAFDGLSLKLAEDLVGIEHCKPVNLIRQFPRIMDRINDLWPSRAAIEYIDSLIISDRLDRAGFQPKILAELCFLKELQGFFYPRPFETSRRIEDLLHARLQVRGIRAFAEMYGPRNDAPELDRGSSRASASTLESPLRQTEWGELDSDAKVLEVIQEQRRSAARLGEILLRFQLITEQDRDECLAAQKAKPGRREPLGKYLVELGKINAMDLRKALVLQSHGLLLNLDMLTLSHPAVSLVPHSVAIELGVVPVQLHGQSLVTAMENPLSYRGKRAMEGLKKMTGLNVRHAWASDLSIERKLQHYRPGRSRTDL